MPKNRWCKKGKQANRRSSQSVISLNEYEDKYLNGDLYLSIEDEHEVKNYHNGKVCFVNKDGFVFEGTLKSGKRFGLGTTHYNLGQRDINWFEDDHPQGHGVRLNQDLDQAWRLYDGKNCGKISIDSAFLIIEGHEKREEKCNQYGCS